MDEQLLIETIKTVIRREFTPIFMALVNGNDNATRVTVQRFPTEGEISNVRSLQPYGFASKAKPLTPTLIIPIAGNATNLTSIGNFDEQRPQVQDGEALLYGPEGQVILMKTGGTIHQGSQAAANPAVLGDVLVTFLRQVIRSFLDSPSIGEGATGPVFLNPTIRTMLEQYLMEGLDNPSTNILAQKIFLERGG